jgi:hypothetical protein
LQSLLQQDGVASSKKSASAAAADDPAAPAQKDDQTGVVPECKAGTSALTGSAATQQSDVATAAAGTLSQQLVRLTLSAAEGGNARVTVNLTAA